MSPPESVGKRVLWILLSVNGSMFIVELAYGWTAESMGLIADSLDMVADAAVYGLALLAVGAASSRTLRAASFAGHVQLLLACAAFAETGRRFLLGSTPDGPTMIGISAIALAANVACLALLRRHRFGEAHLRAAWIFSATDVQANVGVMLAGALVDASGSPLPDLAIGTVVSWLVLRGALRIRREVASATAGGA